MNINRTILQLAAMPMITAMMGLSACAPRKPPVDIISQAKLQISQAENAKTLETSQLELTTAKDHLNKAEQLMDKHKYDEARKYAEKALVEAKLAEEKGASAAAKKTAEETQKSIEVIKQEAAPKQ